MDGYQEAIRRIEETKRTNVDYLNLSDLELNRLPESISQLQNLSTLDLNNNQLNNLPESISQLQNLSTLNLYNNRFSYLPESISQLENLSTLALHNNQLNSLPQSISQLKNLSQFYLHNNELGNLPECISQLQNLSQLYLHNNELGSLPESISQLKNLSQLYLHSNELGSFPESISQLKNLSQLYLANNKLGHLPESISQLKNLSILSLSNNELGSLPESISQLKSLTQLSLSNNQLGNLPENISQLQNLSILDLDNNQLSDLPESISQLKNLSILSLSNNELSSLPESISQLQNLSQLYLHNNQLSNLPESILQLQNLSEFSLYDNQFEVSSEVWELPILEQIQEILKWQKAEVANELLPIHEAKAIFIGESNFGKTHLIELLREKEIKREITTTHGIERSRIEIPYEDDTINLNIWDLGGQEFMRSTHQFFFSERTLYVLVTLARRERNELNHWLKLANQLGGSAPVLIVINKVDINDHDIDRGSLERDYPNIVGFVRTSINDCDETKALDSINKLHDKITSIITDKTLMPSVFQKRRREWFTVKESLENLDADYISYEKYQQLEHIKSLPKDEQKRNLKLLSILGTVVSYVDDPRLTSTHVINPQWIMDGVYKIINDKIIKDDNKGRFNINELTRVLPKDRFPIDKHIFLLELMQKFNLCYQAKDNRNIYFIPDLFEDIEPKYDWEIDKNTIIFRFNYDDFPPNAFMTRFIVEMHESIIDDLRWRSGAYITNKSCQARVYQSFSKNYINIEVKGNLNEYRSYLYHIRETFRKLHKPFPKMVIKQEVPYRGYWLNYESLLKLEARNKSYYHTELENDIPVSEVLNGYALPIERNKDLERIERKIDKNTQLLEDVKVTTEETISLLTFALTETATIQYPNIFTLKPKRVSVRNQSDFNTVYELQLYCFYGEKVGESYEITIPKDWIKQLIPYYNGMLKGLKLVSGVALAVGYGILSVDTFTDNKQNLKAGQSIIDKASNVEESTTVHAYQKRAATQGEMVIIKNILDKAVPNQSWKNDLHKIVKDGKVIWVCGKHR
jgi:internalin A